VRTIWGWAVWEWLQVHFPGQLGMLNTFSGSDGVAQSYLQML